LYAQELNDVARAAVHYKRVIGLKPGHPQAATIRYWLIRNKTDQSPDPDSSVAESISKDREAKPEPAPQSDLNVEVRPDGTVKIVPSENTEKTDVLIQEAEALIQSDKLDGALAKLREAQNFADQNQMPIIMANMGDVHYAKGEHKEAVDLYLKAAEQGYAYAQFSLGFMHQKGEGVAKDYSIAFHWTRKAANQGHVQAQYNLGVFHMNGWGTNANGAKASEWFQKAADNGHVKASQMPGVKKTTEETNIFPTAGDNTEQE
jgi:TPR repeat protein